MLNLKVTIYLTGNEVHAGDLKNLFDELSKPSPYDKLTDLTLDKAEDEITFTVKGHMPELSNKLNYAARNTRESFNQLGFLEIKPISEMTIMKGGEINPRDVNYKFSYEPDDNATLHTLTELSNNKPKQSLCNGYRTGPHCS